MRVYIGADHNGYELKKHLIDYLRRGGYEVIDDGDKAFDPNDDFPQFAGRVVSDMLASSEADPMGILICGSGQGMCMAANRFKGIRASMVWDVREARMARNDDDSNVLCLPARLIDAKQAEMLTNVWLNTPFAGATRFKRRIRQLDELQP